ncbi:amino acid ABC transporter permease [Jiangella asiatica]|uniref:Amino acid ABC transporter permease n=1 Tax=Jiangella asiatica TaxID=2530372 RepID=A0A4R5D559_9ACTN|nr:amino acid ABC transporter permease [Jiangella asiatica]
MTLEGLGLSVPWFDYLPDLWAGLLTTLKFTISGFVGSIVLGLVVALMRVSRVALIRAVASIYTEIFKNLPLITEIYIIYFGLASIGIRFGIFAAATLSFALFYGAYVSEVFRGGLQGVPPGQREASLALGMTPRSVTRHIIVPQALRLALPGAGTMMVDLLKGTALLVTIGGAELMTQGAIITSTTFRALEVYLVIGLIYFSLCYPLSRGVVRLERRLDSGAPLTPSRRRHLKLVDEAMRRRVPRTGDVPA